MRFQSLNRPLVRIDKAYRDTIGDKVKFYLDTRFDNVNHTIRHGECVCDCPPFKKGDELFTRHDVVRRNFNTNDEERYGEHYNNIYALDEVCAYIRDGEYHAIHPFCWVKPIKDDTRKTILYDGDENPDMLQNGEKANMGIMEHSNPMLESMGIHDGDTVIFTKNSEYEYSLDDTQKLYRMQTHWIVGKVVDE
jgi:hypothetical protein